MKGETVLLFSANPPPQPLQFQQPLSPMYPVLQPLYNGYIQLDDDGDGDDDDYHFLRNNQDPCGNFAPKIINVVGSLLTRTTAKDLADIFAEYGIVMEAKVLLDNKGKTKRYGFVMFASAEPVRKLLMT